MWERKSIQEVKDSFFLSIVLYFLHSLRHMRCRLTSVSLCKWPFNHLSLCSITEVRFGSCEHSCLSCHNGTRRIINPGSGWQMRDECWNLSRLYLHLPYLNLAIKMSLPCHHIYVWRSESSNKETRMGDMLKCRQRREIGEIASRITSLITIQNGHIISSHFHTVRYTVTLCAAIHVSVSSHCSDSTSPRQNEWRPSGKMSNINQQLRWQSTL